MTRVRWLFEAWQLRLKEEALSKRISTIGETGLTALRDILVNILGVGLEPIAEKDPDFPTDPEKIKYRWPKQGEYTPLIYAIARPDYLKQAMDKVNSLLPTEEELGSGPDELTEEDLLFFDELKIDEKKALWESPEMQQQLKQYVILKNPKDAKPTDKPTPVTEAERAAWKLEQDNFGKPKRAKFTIDPEPLDVEPKRKS
jgi:hypothetical protein